MFKLERFDESSFQDGKIKRRVTNGKCRESNIIVLKRHLII